MTIDDAFALFATLPGAGQEQYMDEAGNLRDPHGEAFDALKLMAPEAATAIGSHYASIIVNRRVDPNEVVEDSRVMVRGWYDKGNG